MRSIYLSGGFTKEQYLWVIPILISFAKFKKINRLIFENKINRKFLTKKIKNDLSEFSIIEINKNSIFLKLK